MEADLSLLDIREARDGIKLARLKIFERVTSGQPYTSIVLPTRYGKGEAIRLLSYEMAYRRMICAAVGVSPSIVLMRQLVDPKKMERTRQRYDMTRPFPHRTLKRMTTNFAANGEILISTTIQLIQQNLAAFTSWVESMTYRTGLPVFIFWDESHQESDRNEWGKVIPACGEAGALAALMTATPYRRNNEKISCFEYETIEEHTKRREYSVRTGETDEGKWTYHTSVYDETHQLVAIKPDVLVTFRQAWRVEKPPCLCFINRIGIDVSLEDIKTTNHDVEKLSQLAATATRALLWKIVREPFVIRQVLRKFIEVLRDRKKIHPLSRGIVFTTNDQASDREVNKHAKRCETILMREAPELKVLILTMNNEEEAAQLMNIFLDESQLSYDVIIVKAMGNAGLDCKWLKVAADLSSVRSDNSYIQRMMRIATISPEDGLLIGDFITPDDVLSRDIFGRLVDQEGGALDLVTAALVDEYDTERDKKDPTAKPILMATGTELSDFEDNLGNWSDRTYAPHVAVIRQTFIGSSSKQTDAEMASIIKRWPLEVQEFFGKQYPSDDVNSETMIEDLRTSINDIADQATKTVMFVIKQIPYSGEAWKSIRTEFFTNVYQRCGVRAGVDLSEIDDMAILDSIRREALSSHEAIKEHR